MCVAVSVAVVVGVIMASSVCLGLALTDNKTHHEKIVYQLPVNDMGEKRDIGTSAV